jgi:hypothetical protein
VCSPTSTAFASCPSFQQRRLESSRVSPAHSTTLQDSILARSHYPNLASLITKPQLSSQLTTMASTSLCSASLRVAPATKAPKHTARVTAARASPALAGKRAHLSAHLSAQSKVRALPTPSHGVHAGGGLLPPRALSVPSRGGETRLIRMLDEQHTDCTCHRSIGNVHGCRGS